MQLVGEEKRIQALFSDVRLADEQTTPSFVGVWSRAQAKTIRKPRAFSLSFVAAIAVLVCAFVSLVWWSTHRAGNRDVVATVPSGLVADPVKVGIENEAVNLPTPVPKSVSPGEGSRVFKLAARRAALVAANRKAMREAKTIASWRSPTAVLLDSQTDELLKSLPQLNQTVDELKSFLPSQPR